MGKSVMEIILRVEHNAALKAFQQVTNEVKGMPGPLGVLGNVSGGVFDFMSKAATGPQGAILAVADAFSRAGMAAYEFGKSAINAALSAQGALEELMLTTGMSVENAQALAGVANEVGLSTEELAGMMAREARAAQEAINKENEARAKQREDIAETSAKAQQAAQEYRRAMAWWQWATRNTALMGQSDWRRLGEQVHRAEQNYREALQQFERARTVVPQVTTPYSQLNVQLKDQNGQMRDASVRVRDLMNAFQALPDGVQKSALAMEIFGRGGTRAIEFLNEGGSAADRMKARFAELGLKMTQTQFDAVDQFDRQVNRLLLTLEIFKVKVGTELIQALGPTLDEVQKQADAWLKWEKRTGFLSQTLPGIARDVAEITKSLVELSGVLAPFLLKWAQFQALLTNLSPLVSIPRMLRGQKPIGVESILPPRGAAGARPTRVSLSRTNSMQVVLDIQSDTEIVLDKIARGLVTA